MKKKNFKYQVINQQNVCNVDSKCYRRSVKEERDWDVNRVFKKDASLGKYFQNFKFLSMEVDLFTQIKHFTELQNIKRDKYRNGYIRSRKNTVIIPTSVLPIAFRSHL